MTTFGNARLAIFLIALEAGVIGLGINALGEIGRAGLSASIKLSNRPSEPAGTPAWLVLLCCVAFVVGSMGLGIWMLLRRAPRP